MKICEFIGNCTVSLEYYYISVLQITTIEINFVNQFFENESNGNTPRIVLYIQHLIQAKPIFDQVSLEN